MGRSTRYFGLIVIFMLLAMRIVMAQQPVFRIGVLDDELGPISAGARLAVDELNMLGGAQGADGTFFRLELVVQPAGANIENAIININQASVIAVLGPLTTDEVLNNLQALQGMNVPILTAANGDTILPSDSTGRIFLSRAADVYEARALANYLISDLEATRIATVQLDQNLLTQAGIIGFSQATSSQGIVPQPALLLQDGSDNSELVNGILQANPEVVVTYGDPALASAFYNDLRANGYGGLFAYNQALSVNFQSSVQFGLLTAIMSTTNWPFSATDPKSDVFLDSYTRFVGRVPDAVAAATYDSVYLLAEAIRQPGELRSNLAQLVGVIGVQGALNPGQLTRGETSNNVAVVQLNGYGAPIILARYAGNERLSIDQPVGPQNTPVPPATATPEGVVVTITRSAQNVRTGPGTNYDVLGQLRQGEQARVIGANIDQSWLVIEFRAQQGWLSRSILEVFGDLNTVPVIAPPPTPTPPPSPTASPVADIVIENATVAPSPIVPNQAFILSVTVCNRGGSNAGQFGVAATLPPNNVYTSAVVSSLAAGQCTVANLTGTLTNTGFYSVLIVSDLNNEVQEGAGENNNTFNFSYIVNKPILRQATQTLNPGDTLDLEGNAVQGDANWRADASALDGIFGAQLGIITNVDLSTIHWDLINPTIINQTSIPRASLNPGTILGIITADGNRGVIRVDALPGNQLSVTFLVFQN
jgi:ABC-type branched-subunit amino acid transport system substrate-binding protein/uncharacterized protein YgiM (DUF1202 family)